MESNPLPWPSFEQLGREIHLALKLPLERLEAPLDEAINAVADQHLTRLYHWLNAPCYCTVKLDGTNCGVDNNGLFVGRTTLVAEGQTYQKVDIRSMLAELPAKAEHIRSIFGESVAQVMLYGELCIHGKHDYMDCGIHRTWLCFGAVLRPEADDEKAAARLCGQLREAGFNAYAGACGEVVTVSINNQFSELLHTIGVQTVAGQYKPKQMDADTWNEHGTLAHFSSMKEMLQSDWLLRFLCPAEGQPLGEGFVVASEADGRLFKLKHGGEDIGSVPDQLRELLRRIPELEGVEGVDPELESVLQVLLKFCVKPPVVEKKTKKQVSMPAEDTDAMAVLESALTKIDALDSIFARGEKAAIEGWLVEQVTTDLMKDYECRLKAAKPRALKIVRSYVGQRYGEWKRSTKL